MTIQSKAPAIAKADLRNTLFDQFGAPSITTKQNALFTVEVVISYLKVR